MHSYLSRKYTCKSVVSKCVLIVCSVIFCATTFCSEKVYHSIGKYGLIDKPQYAKLDHIKTMRGVYAHPTGAAPSEEEVLAAMVIAVDSIEPSSLTGKVDLIAAQGNEDPLLVDVKVFDDSARNKDYILKGFNQVYSYTQKFNKPSGALVIFNVSNKLLHCVVDETGDIPLVQINGKTIFLMTIELPPIDKAPSRKGRIKAITISKDDFIKCVS